MKECEYDGPFRFGPLSGCCFAVDCGTEVSACEVSPPGEMGVAYSTRHLFSLIKERIQATELKKREGADEWYEGRTILSTKNSEGVGKKWCL